MSREPPPLVRYRVVTEHKSVAPHKQILHPERGRVGEREKIEKKEVIGCIVHMYI